MFVLVLATFIIPPQVLLIPRYIFFNELNLLGSLNAFMLPALTGQGLNSAIFILIFYQFFRMLPNALVEAAQIDGAGHLTDIPYDCHSNGSASDYHFILVFICLVLERDILGIDLLRK